MQDQKSNATIGGIGFSLIAGICLFMAVIGVAPVVCILVMLGSLVIVGAMVIKLMAAASVLKQLGVK